VPLAEPTVARGEFVRAELTPDPAHSRPDAPAWESSAVLTRGKVDTFLFLNFHFAKPLDLGDANCLVVDSWVPEGQPTPNQLLFILHEEGGGDFIAETGRSLGQPGRETSFVPLSRFQLAGWTKDADGVLDPKRISEIRVGWGGYLGAEGEKVRFSAALPQVGAIRSSPAGAAAR
jgi:hypothetical protein